MTTAKSKIGVLRFPGTNCDRDVFQAVADHGHEAVWLWHQDQFNARDFAALYLPGGFSYGDYLRAGALAARAPAMKSVREAAQFGIPVLGICNGFQILCEAGLLPGVLVRNSGRRFIDRWVDLTPESKHARFAAKTPKSVRLPIAHADGRYFVEDDELKRLEDQGQIWFRYQGDAPNGATAKIAGVMSAEKNVAALMPHPERAIKVCMGGTDGNIFF